jgi:Fe-S cluster assembly protein SufD
LKGCSACPQRAGFFEARQLIARGFSVDVLERLKNDEVEELVLKFIDDKFDHIASRGA